MVIADLVVLRTIVQPVFMAVPNDEIVEQRRCDGQCRAGQQTLDKRSQPAKVVLTLGPPAKVVLSRSAFKSCAF